MGKMARVLSSRALKKMYFYAASHPKSDAFDLEMSQFSTWVTYIDLKIRRPLIFVTILCCLIK